MGLRSLSRSILSPRVYTALKLFRDQLRGNIPILVYQMGKVGSTSVYKALDTALPNHQIFHVHYLQKSETDRMRKKYRKAGLKTMYEHLIHSQHFQTYTALGGNHFTNAYLTIVRDPVDCMLSHVFHNPRVHRPYLYKEDGELKVAADIMNIIRSDVESMNEKSHIFNWIEREFNTYLKVNVYESDFNVKEGYGFISETKKKIGILTLEKLSNDNLKTFLDDAGIESDAAINLMHKNRN